ncbi:MAG TPA: phosphonatase-like hydrolase [Chitinophagaceae bacterium]|nr:phosphonatase-like hydrolase [Chitinophagaceae bacterium]
MIKMVVFDMAGTTVDEDNVVYKTLRKAINEHGFNFSLEEVLAQGAGKEKFQAVKSILSVYAGITEEKMAVEIYERFVPMLAEAYNSLQVLPQPGAVELFRALHQRNILVVLNTGYNRETAESLITKLGWKQGREFDYLVTANDVTKNRPDPDMILFAMKQLGISNPAEVAKVGDSIIDIEEGRNAGCSLNIGITTGAHTFQQLKSANPDRIINNLMELLPVVAEN